MLGYDKDELNVPSLLASLLLERLGLVLAVFVPVILVLFFIGGRGGRVDRSGHRHMVNVCSCPQQIDNSYLIGFGECEGEGEGVVSSPIDTGMASRNDYFDLQIMRA